ncbi:hypothetical protein [Massilia sp. DWR3-1-1]|uniref:hypothetical protein n=1 Tax=Massilia sp. DWR3-1-1 TaxID=2804559 RepID=UPI003CECDE70
MAKLAVGIGLAAAQAAPAPLPRTGEADVREGGGGVPCFTIAERDERRDGAPSFQAISVVDVARKPRTTMWAMAMPADRTFPLMFSMCIPYAGRVAALPQEEAEALAPDTVYEVAIAVRGGSGKLPAAYVRRFCLARQADGTRAVRLLGAAATACAGAAPRALKKPGQRS